MPFQEDMELQQIKIILKLRLTSNEEFEDK